MKQYLCSECGGPCDGHLMDFGIGGWEQGDRSGFHRNERHVSECCDSPMIDQFGMEVPQIVERPEPYIEMDD